MLFRSSLAEVDKSDAVLFYNMNNYLASVSTFALAK